MRYLRFFLLLLTSIVIFACGGGGGSSTPVPTPSASQVLDDGQLYDVHNTVVINDAAQSEFLATDSNNYYSFNVIQGQKYTITLKSLPGGDSDLAVFNDNELSVSTLIGLSISFTSPDIVEFSATESKTYYMEVYNHIAGDYTIVIETTPRKLADGVMYDTNGHTVEEILIDDMNGDGLDDIVYMTTLDIGVDQEIGIYYQQAGGGFTKGFSRTFSSLAGGYSFSAIAVGDFDGDGANDLIVATNDTDSITGLDAKINIHLQDVITKTIINNYQEYPSIFARDMLLVDINNDNKADVVAHFNQQLVFYMQNNTGGLDSYVENNVAKVNNSFTILETLDESNDGDNDILYHTTGKSSVILVNDPTATFTQSIILEGLTDNRSFLEIYDVGDINGDALFDVIMVDRGYIFNFNTALLNIFIQDTSGIFNRSVSLSPFGNNGACEVVIADITGDALMDLVGYASQIGDVLVSRQLNNTTFNDAVRYTGHTTIDSTARCSPSKLIATGDFNDDGYTDVVVGRNSSSGGVFILLNEPG